MVNTKLIQTGIEVNKFEYETTKESYKELIRESFVIPFNEVRRLTDSLNFGNAHRVAVIIAQLTGCRLSELCRMTINCLRPVNEGLLIVWKKGKNQKGSRHYLLKNKEFIKEIYFYLNNIRSLPVNDHRLFPFNANSFNQYINRFVRPLVGGKWICKLPEQKGNQIANSYVYQLKSLRHNRLSVEYVKNYRIYKDAMISAEFTAREFGHSTFKISIRYYCDAIKELGLLNLPDCCLDIEKILFDSSILNQTKLC